MLFPYQCTASANNATYLLLLLILVSYRCTDSDTTAILVLLLIVLMLAPTSAPLEQLLHFPSIFSAANESSLPVPFY